MKAGRSRVLPSTKARLVLGAPLLAASVACGLAPATPAQVVPIAAVNAPPLVVAVDPSAAKEKPACISEDARENHLVAAWPENDRVYYCLTPDEEGPTDARVCSSIGKAGDLRHEALRSGKPPPLPRVPFAKESADGKLVFRIQGGERDPKKATGVLEQTTPKKVLKRAPIEYDEHIAFEGFIGQGVVYRTWVDEGPGCGLSLVDPKKSWPSGIENESAVGLGGCYGDHPMLRTQPDEVAIVDGGGSLVTFVNEKTLSATALELDRQGGPEMGTAYAAWLEGRVLVLVYGAPISGDMVRVDLDRRAIVSSFSPTICPRKAKPDAER